jgi:hypothetical protein
MVKVRIHSRDFLKYPILSKNKPIGYMLCQTNGEVEEFGVSPFPAKGFVSVKSFPHYKYFLNSHATVCAMLVDYLGLRGNDSEKSFIASVNVFIEKCLCSQPGQPLIYDIAKGLQDFASYKKKRLLIKELYKSDSGDKALNFYLEKIKQKEPLIVSFVFDKEGRSRERAKERREAETFLGVGELMVGKEIYLILWDTKMEDFVAKSWDGSHTNIIVTEVRVEK